MCITHPKFIMEFTHISNSFITISVFVIIDSIYVDITMGNTPFIKNISGFCKALKVLAKCAICISIALSKYITCWSLHDARREINQMPGTLDPAVILTHWVPNKMSPDWNTELSTSSALKQMFVLRFKLPRNNKSPLVRAMAWSWIYHLLKTDCRCLSGKWFLFLYIRLKNMSI